MGVSVVKSGPYFSSGPIKWSDLRNNFKEISSGEVSASELFVDTRLAVRDPIVPDSTENTSIPTDGYPGGVFSETSNNWKASLMRDSIKRYTANQTGSDENLDLGFKSGSGGIDWDGQNNLDTEGNTTGNYTRNVQKIININGICYSSDTGDNGVSGGGGTGSGKKAACSLVLEKGVPIGSGTLKALNVRFYLKSGSGIYGSAGRLGYFPDTYSDKTLSDPGKDGGVALTIRHEGQENRTWIYNEGGELFGGGGGGEQGEQGAWPVQAGTCDRGYSTSCSSGYYFGGYDEGCHGSSSGGCNAGDQTYMLHIATLPCPGGGGSGSIYAYYCRYTSCSTTYLGSYASTLPEQGRGGAGGEGAGWGFRVSVGGGKQPATQGEGGKANKPASCSGGETPTGASNSSPGGSGGNGGDYGQPGGSTNGISPSATGLSQGEGGGKGGAAMCGRYFNPTIQGYNTAQYVKGSVGLECDGTQGTPVIPPGIPTVTINSHSSYVRFNYPENDGTNKQTLRCTNSSNGQPVSFKIWHIWDDLETGSYSSIALLSFKIKDSNGTVKYESVKSGERDNKLSPVLTLDEGIYDVEWEQLNSNNRPPSGANWVRNSNILEFGQRIELFDDAGSGGMGSGDKINAEIIICPQDQTADGTTSWTKSYSGSAMDGVNPDGSYEYIAIKQYWSQFMRDLAVWEQNSDPKTQVGDFAATQSYLLESGVAGEHTIEIQSDNDCELFLNQAHVASTTTYESHYPMNVGISQCGRWVSKNANSGKAVDTVVTDGTPIKYNYSGEKRAFSVTCKNRKFLTEDYSTVYGPAYLENQNYIKQFTNAAGTAQEYTIVYQGVEKGRITIGGNQDFPLEITDTDGVKRKFYSGTRVVNNGNPWDFPDYWEIRVEEHTNPEDWQHNPAGVAFRVKDPNGNVVLESTDFDQAEGSVWGRGSVNWSVTGVDLNVPTDSIYQIQSPVNDQSFTLTPGQTSGTSAFSPTYGVQTYKIYAKNSGGTSSPPGEVVVQ